MFESKMTIALSCRYLLFLARLEARKIIALTFIQKGTTPTTIMKFFISAPSMVVLAASSTTLFSMVAFVEGSKASFPARDELSLVNIQTMMQEIEDFVPLTCNADLATAPCRSWSSQFGTKSTLDKRIIIPCGECVFMNRIDGDTLTLSDGLDIRGKLVFPGNGYRLTLYSTLISVQGELVMTSQDAVDGDPLIHVILTGQEDQYFSTAGGVNKYACDGGSNCNAGKKGIVVAGGKVTSKYFHVAKCAL
jgi:hypothetical protein